jgi:hypothetical protein
MSDNRVSIPQVSDNSELHVPGTTFLLGDSEEYLESELNQAGVRSRCGAGDYSEVGVIRPATGCVRWGELCAIE